MVKISKFQEDMLFKNTSEEDANIILEIMGQEKSKTVRIWKEELRLLDSYLQTRFDY